MAVDILGCTGTVGQRATVLHKVIQLAQELRDTAHDLYAFSAVMKALELPQVTCCGYLYTRNPVAQSHTFIPVTQSNTFIPVTQSNSFIPVTQSYTFKPVTQSNIFIPGDIDSGMFQVGSLRCIPGHRASGVF